MKSSKVGNDIAAAADSVEKPLQMTRRRRFFMRAALALGVMPLLVACHDDDDDNAVPPPKASDLRLKDNVRRIGRTQSGLPLYVFSYKGRPEQFTGVMAQDVLAVRPDAVSVGSNGYYAVDYHKLGLRMLRVA
jgi:Chaperone of endosialidase